MTTTLSRTMLGVEVAYKAVGRPVVVGYHSVPTTPEVEQQLGVGRSPVALALGSPVHHTGPFVVAGLAGFAGATSPMALDQQQS